VDCIIGLGNIKEDGGTGSVEGVKDVGEKRGEVYVVSYVPEREVCSVLRSNGVEEGGDVPCG
jgi:hypothetical protein